ncbi:bifunctional riboflavin kinase/FAD synthetase [Methylomonas sp. AM2-LC]|uniref:bifunctional riboflavin kinase/FAD synthetase n=1 Tax=Methylomonas sp. AM2-LC TaxID=3153301 RepID=UPI003266AFD5
MRLIRGLNHLDAFGDGCILTIGNFDGLHLGHQLLIKKLAEHGKRLNLPVVVMVFEPQPLEYFLGEHAPSRLTRLREKVIQFAKLPVDQLLVLPFNQQLSDYDAEQFIDDILVKRLHVKHVVVGDDFHFGKARRGNFSLLQSKGQDYGFTVENSQSFELAGLRISSTLIRDALQEGSMDKARIMLGRDYSVCGRVAHGDKRGRQLGFPTANVDMFRKIAPIAGVFAVSLTGLDGKEYQGVANVGTRPTFKGSAKAILETHLFNFNADIYGRYVEVHFKAKIRNELKFPSFEALQSQIQEDIQMSKQFLEHLKP